MNNNIRKIVSEKSAIVIPQGTFCGHNCADGCIYWNPRDRDQHDRQYCSYYHTHYYPRDRQGCLSFKG